MIVRSSYHSQICEDIWAGRRYCSHCGQVTNSHLILIKLHAYISFIPIISLVQKRGIACDVCAEWKELSKDEYKNFKRQQENALASGIFPEYVIIRDFFPTKQKLGLKRFWLIIASIYFFITIMSMIGMISEIGVFAIFDFESVFAFFIFISIFLIPAGLWALALKKFYIAKKRVRMYENVKKYSKN